MSSRVPAEWNGENGPNFFLGNRESFKDMATDSVFPRWLRVTFAAYAEVGRNGHATFRPKRLAWILGEHDGPISTPTTRQRVREAIDRAIDHRLLEPESKALCLVVPPMVVAFGKGEVMPCPRHPEKRNARTVSPDTETTRFQPVVSSTDERQDRVVSGSGSLFSLPPGASAPEPQRRGA